MTSNAAQLTERTRSMIMALIKANIASELAAIRSDRNDPTVKTNPPVDYLIYETNLTYKCPCIFVIVDSFEPQDDQLNPNHVNAKVKVFVSAVVEAQEAYALTITTERYQAALFKILQWATLTDTDNNVKLWSRVLRCAFSPIYTKDKKQSDNLGNFRKEVSLELEVKHYENPNV